MIIRRLAAIGALVAGLAGAARAQAPPDPNYVRQPLFGSYAEFRGEIDRIAGVADPMARTAQLDALWSQLRAAGQVPYAQGNRAAFLYRGAASSVSFPGDVNGWNASSSAVRATQVAGTNLWMWETTLPPDARLDYKIVLGGSNWILDPANPLQMWSGFGPNSELRMPDYQYPRDTVRAAGLARGTLSPNVTLPSPQLGASINYRVYTPAGYAAGELANLPVVYVTDGHEYAADHMGSMTAVLDNLIADGRIRPTIAVFIDPRDPTTGQNRRAEHYVQNSRFAAFVADALVPAIDGEYRTDPAAAARTILGTSLGGLNSAYFGAQRPDVFGNIAVQSPASFGSFAPGLLDAYRTQPLADRLRLFVSAGTINDGAGGRQFAAVLAERGYDFAFVESNEGHSWGQWRGVLDDMLVHLVGPAAAIPEPATAGLAGAAMASLACGRRLAACRRGGFADPDSCKPARPLRRVRAR